MQKYIDSHCHIGDGTTDYTVDAFVCNSVTESDWDRILLLSDANAAVIPCIGIHPWYVNNVMAKWDVRLQDYLARCPKCMVGEIGLDKLHPDYDLQQDVFTRQLNIAAQMSRPVHIHCVRAWGDMVDILTNMPNLPPVIVFHAFAASTEIMHQLSKLKSRVYFSFSDAICDARRHNLVDMVRDVDIDRILVESDGVMSESGAVLRRVITHIAVLRNMNIASLTDTIYNNAKMVI